MPRPLGRTRERMLDVAESLFQRYGYAGVAVEDVTSALGMQKPNLYNHFRDKNELYVAVRRRQLERLGADLQRVLTVDAPFADRLQAVMAVLLRHPYFLSGTIQYDIESFLHQEARAFLFAQSYGTIYEPVTALLRAGVTAGALRLEDEDIPFAFEAMVGLVSHFAAIAPGGDPVTRAETAARLTNLLLSGIGNPD